MHTGEIPIYDPSVSPVLDKLQILNLLPHRPPFLFVDKILELSDTHVVGIKEIKLEEHYFKGHFPNDPIMPGVLQVEALAQTGGILALSLQDNPQEYSTYFLRIEECKFRKPVRPDCVLILKTVLEAPIRRGIFQMRGYAFVDNELVSESKLTAKIFKKSSIENGN